MRRPFSFQRLIMEALDGPQPGWTRNPDDIFPFLIALLDFKRHFSQRALKPFPFEDRPHTKYILYSFEHVNTKTGEPTPVSHYYSASGTLRQTVVDQCDAAMLTL